MSCMEGYAKEGHVAKARTQVTKIFFKLQQRGRIHRLT